MAGIGGMDAMKTASMPVHNAPAQSAQRVAPEAVRPSREPAPRGVQQERTAETGRTTDAAREAAEKARQAQVTGLEIEDVISVSKDGDTVQAGRESLEKLEDDRFGRVIRLDDQAQAATVQAQEETQAQRAEAAQEAREAAARALEEARQAQQAAREKIAETAAQNTKESEREDRAETLEVRDERAQQQITSFQGYTDQQLQQMYNRGEISKNDYDREMATREQSREERTERTAEFSNEMAENAAGAQQVQQDRTQIETAFGEDSSETVAPEDRVDAMDAVQKALQL